MSRLRCKVYNFAQGALTDYQSAWRMQKALAEHSSKMFKSNQPHPDSLLIVQHPSIYSLGRGSTPDNIKFKVNESCPHKVVRVERGGEVTWHGPGQLVAYPIINLNNHKKDLHWFSTQLEQSSINALRHFGIMGERSDVNTGVWVGKNKISAVGLTASRWITMHGTSLNVNCDLRHFEEIIPCGIRQSDRGVCSIQGLHNTLAGHLSGESFAFEDESQISAADEVDIGHVANKWIEAFGEVFKFDLELPKIAASKGSEAYETEMEASRQQQRAELEALIAQYPAIAGLNVEYYTSPVEEEV